jgi:sugar/nucleoside kinase (ribokinase family)
MIAEIRAAKIPIFFDPASVGAMKEIDVEEVKSWLPLFDCLLLNEEEAIYLTGESDLEKALDLLLLDCETVVIKRGSQGAIGKIHGGQSISVDALHADVVDTTGAGDSFAAGFISEFTQSHDLHRSLSAGAAIAARCVAIIGARPRVGTEV